MVRKMKTKNIYGKGICQHCVELGIKEERARHKKKIKELKKRLDNPAHEIKCSSYQIHGIIDEVLGEK